MSRAPERPSSPMLQNKQVLLDLINRQIRKLSGLRFWWPTFPEQLEERFERDTEERRCRRLWLEGLIAIALFDLFLIGDHLNSSPREFWRAFVVRALIVTPVCLIVNASMLRKPGRVVRESSIVLGATIAGLTHLYLESNRSIAASAYAHLAVMAVILFTNIVMRLQFPYAIAASMIMLMGESVFLHYDHMLSHDEKLVAMMMIAAVSLITLVANYSAIREERLNYLLSIRDEMLVKDLNRLNAQLVRHSESDALTGLANRRSFDTQFAHLWKRAIVASNALSVIVVDVDNFKKLNDNYGHLYGDEVLRRIGSLLQQALRAKDDFAARYGGEEFIILLPSTPLSAAAQVAERLCKMVELAGFPPLDPAQTPYNSNTTATVSCGVATAYPTLREVPEQLLEAADKAMYQAKADGRNRVSCAPALAGVSLSA
ncbi:MAG: GGDEF domain-containing protein [Edaphobacter sp.]|uniref:GGDEF domain-containing protein n=1 Tax=Edaphobacter sp. TaxID=1934404 RepID=UPI0023861FE2|nr:GGDEF domain-containing protein [Edaphobacter sp.]MDE1176470.1 GGDEF domain-containing protein [Edaphobacter sp.]